MMMILLLSYSHLNRKKHRQQCEMYAMADEVKKADDSNVQTNEQANTSRLQLEVSMIHRLTTIGYSSLTKSCADMSNSSVR